MQASETSTAPLYALACLSFVWLVAVVANLRAVHQLALVLLLSAWWVRVLGRRAVHVVAPIAATFLLAVPIWGALVPILRRMTVVASGALVGLLRVPAEIQGDFISIESGTFIVENGCAGLNYLLGGLVIGAFYANLVLTGWRARVAVVALIGAISVVGNWIRVASLVVIGHVTHMQSSVIGNHLWLGWVIFSVGLIPFFLIARKLEQRDHAAQRAPTRSSGGEGETIAFHERVAWPERARRAAFASLVAITGPLLYSVFAAMPPADLRTWPSVDDEIGGWMLAETLPRPFTWLPRYEGADERYSASLERGDAHVYVDRLVYRGQSQGRELIHSENRIAGPDEVLRDGITGGVRTNGRWVRQAIVRAPEGPILVWYWFRVGGIDTFSPLRAKALEVVAFFRRSARAELLAVSAPCDADDCLRALEALSGFMISRGGGPMQF